MARNRSVFNDLNFYGDAFFQHTCIAKVFTAASKVYSRCQGNIENVKYFAGLLPLALLTLPNCEYLISPLRLDC